MYTGLGDALNTDYTYQTDAPYAMLTETSPAPNADGSGTRAVTTNVYDGNNYTGFVREEFEMSIPSSQSRR